MLLLRKILFYLLIVVYIVVCPLMVLYALGYIFKPGTEHGLAKTGLIYLSTLPSGATLYVGNKRFTEKTPTMLRDLLPGDYPIAVFLKGYRPWTRVVSVEAEKALALDRILLLPNHWKSRVLDSDEFDSLIPFYSDRFLLLTKGTDLEDLWLYDRREQKIFPLISEKLPFKNTRIVSHFSVRESGHLLLRTQLGLWGEEKFFWIEPDVPKAKIKEVTDLFLSKPQTVDCDPHNTKYLFTFRDGVLDRLDMDSQTVRPKFMENVRGVGLYDKKVYILSLEGKLLRTDTEGKNFVFLEKNHPWDSLISNENQFFKIEVLLKDKIFFLGNKGNLWINYPPYHLADDGVIGIEPEPQTKKVLVWGKNRLGILKFSNSSDESEPHEETAQIQWIFKNGRKISQVFWVYEGSHILFRDDDKVYLLELLPFGKTQLYECFHVKHGSSIVYREQSGKVYFIERETGHLCETEILPKREMALLQNSKEPLEDLETRNQAP